MRSYPARWLTACVIVIGGATAVTAVTGAGAASARTVGTRAAVAAEGRTPATGVWQDPEPVPGLAALDVDHDSSLSVSCTAPGECGGGGLYDDSHGHLQAFVVDEHKGIWGKAEEVPGTAALNAGGDAAVSVISCASPGNCAVGGTYTDSAGDTQLWVANEIGGVWGPAQQLTGLAGTGNPGFTLMNSISCAGPGSCAAGGTYSVSSAVGPKYSAFVASETNGVWSAIEVPGTDGTDATLNTVSCGSPGDCVAGGGNNPNAADAGAFTVTETSGTWGSAQLVPGTGTLPGLQPAITAISCESSGCDAVGTTGPFSGEGFSVTETGGTWSEAAALPLPFTVPSGDVGSLRPESISCTAPGDCATVGSTGLSTISSLGNAGAIGFYANEVNGTWGAPQPSPDAGALSPDGDTFQLSSVSCPATGDCTAVGLAGVDAYSVSEANGTWGSPRVITEGDIQTASSSVSCPAVAYCVIGGGYSPAGGQYTAFVMDETPVLPTTTAESLSIPRAPYGHEQSVRVSVRVSAALGIVSGKATVTSGGKALCTITLASGAGSCLLAPTRLAAGIHRLTAAYGATLGFAASMSSADTLTVAAAASKTALTLLRGNVRYGHEQAEVLTVRVTPQYAGIPAGAVAVKAGATRLCLITLKLGTGSCRLSARQLRTGKYTLTATYHGTAEFKASTSAKHPLTVT
jgi:hypothetical protein